MKLNGKTNIITDKDITITGVSNSGDTLSEVLENQQKNIDNLKGNVKWIYKYGGVGSGGGGGTGPTKWNVVASLDGKSIATGNTIALDSGPGNYELDVKISGGKDSYFVEIKYSNVTKHIELTPANGWRSVLNIELNSNDTISLSAYDGSIYKDINADYIIFPYIFDDLYLYKTNLEDTWSGTNDILISDAKNEGLSIASNYSISVNAETKYSWTFNEKEFPEEFLTKKNGKIVYEVPSELFEFENAGLYNIKLKILITPENQTPVEINKSINFNLIPQDLYLKIEPENPGEAIYDEIPTSIEGVHQYSTNKSIGFNCRVYMGRNKGRACHIEYITHALDSEEITTHDFYGREGDTNLLSFTLKTPGWHRLTFKYAMDNTSDEITKYLYCFKVDSDYDWFKLDKTGVLLSSKAHISSSKYFRLGEGSNIDLKDRLDMTINSSEFGISYNLNPDNNFDGQDIMMNIGIQYNTINNIDDPILKFWCTDSESVTVYQNKIIIGDPFFAAKNTREIFLKKELEYDPQDPSKFHLLTITHTKICKSGNDDLYQINFYIDGILEGALGNFSNASSIINKVTFYKGNYSINLVDVEYLTGSEKAALNDIDIVYYYYSFLSKMNNKEINEETTIMLMNFYDAKVGSSYTLENQLIKVPSTLCNNIATHMEIPTLVLKREKQITEYPGKPFVLDWLNKEYSDNDLGNDDTSLRDIKVPVSVYWGRNKNELKEIKLDPHIYDNSKFYMKIQGSSTMRYKSKNLTLGIETDPSLGGNSKIIFSPNYATEDNTTFLPEQAFTLKADVVDSSHSNNTSVGKFINDNNNFEYSKGQKEVDKNILGHVKQCLEGFPILMYLELTEGGDSSKTETYYLGVYNFNLGRDSYFNLGYCDLSQLKDVKDAPVDGFSITIVNDLNPLSNFIAAEVQDNKKYWDFSQFDDSILFKDDNITTGDSGYMFGDIVRNSNNDNYKAPISNFVKTIAFGGGYIFNKIGKVFKPVGDKDSDIYAYHTENTVPDYQVQYKRTSKGFERKPDEIAKAESPELLARCIRPSEDGSYTPVLNYNSAIYYYTTCMAFGLVDSVQKNLNIKTWDGKNFGMFFYDMDTCLGTSNSGGNTSYFCFSDYWKSDIQKIGMEGETPIMLNNGVTIYRDYYPLGEEGVPTGYDIPSSYLFSIPKYTRSFKEYTDYKAPQDLWGEWRSSKKTTNEGEKEGPLCNANAFIDKYYAGNLRNIPEFLLNLNYRNKYLYANSGTMYTVEYSNLYGTKIEKTRDWLNNRLHILDAYFNLSKENVFINGTITEPICRQQDLNENPDIYILRDIFTEKDEKGLPKTKINREGPCKFTVTAGDYSPLIVKKASELSRYLLEDSRVKYVINENFSGNMVSNFGGSDLWTSVESINPFVTTLQDNATFICFSDKLDNLKGDEGFISNKWLLKTPSVKKLSLTSPKYKGELIIDDSFYNLSDIDISGSGISLKVQGSNVNSVDLTNINSESIEFTNCNHLQNVTIFNSNIDKCTITPAWSKDAEFSNSKIKDLTITGKRENNSLGELTLKDSQILKKLNFSNFSVININNCSELSEISCIDTDFNLIKAISITNCPKLTSIIVPIDDVHAIDLHGCTNLNRLVLKGTKKNGKLDFNKLVLLDLSKTKVTHIIFIDEKRNEEEIIEYLDLTKFSSLAKEKDLLSKNGYFKINYNQDVVAIRATNDKNTPFCLKHNFTGCKNLQRIYGNYSIKTTSCFYQADSFSIHGSDLSIARWKNKKLISGNGTILTPWDVLGISYNKITSLDLFQEGNLVTNISFGITNANSAFAYTSCTIFDYYYTFYNNPKLVSCSGMFEYNRNGKYGIFNYDVKSGLDNSPNRYMFFRNSSITDIGGCFAYPTSNSDLKESPKIRIISPEHDDEGRILRENGLFTPLRNLEYCFFPFYGYSYITDRFTFRTDLPGGYSKLKSLTYYNPGVICDNAETISLKEAFKDYLFDNVKAYGNISDFFNDTPNLSNITMFLYNTLVINYEKIQGNNFTFPKNIKEIKDCFNSTYGFGPITLSDYFLGPENIEYIYQSFRVFDPEYGYATLNLNNNTFSSFINIKIIGYGGSGDGSSSDFRDSSFNGKGNKKIINNPDGFPYDIFLNNSKLEVASTIFMNAIPDMTYGNVKLPGNMFSNNSKLKDLSGLFYNMQVDYTLTPSEEKLEDGSIIHYTNFSNCKNLENIQYLFGQSSDDNSQKPRLTGMIPKKLFEHGSYVKSKTIIGTDTRVLHPEETDPETGEIIKPAYYTYENVQTKKIEYPEYFKTIKNMQYCFEHCGCSYYRNDKIDDDIEININYMPFEFVQNSAGIFKREIKDERLYTIIWSFDGFNKPINYTENEYENLDTVNFESKEGLNPKYSVGCVEIGIEEGSEGICEKSNYYCCPPDLLRYCTEDANIKGLFSTSGVRGWSRKYNNAGNYNKYGYGITGRICPYLLKPVSKTRNIDQMFYSCKKLSYYIDNTDQRGYMIPQDFFKYAKYIDSMERTFGDMLFPDKANINEVFKPLINTLDIYRLFYETYWHSENGSTTDINRVFKDKMVSKTTEAFCITTVDGAVDRVRNQHIVFSDVFNPRYLAPIYDNNMDYANTFRGYDSNTVTFGKRTLPDNTTTNNYKLV